MTQKYAICRRCGDLAKLLPGGEEFCPSCDKGNAELPQTKVLVGADEIPGRIERTNPTCTQEKYDLALRIVRDAAAGRPCHQAALDVLRRIEG